ncbi:hypothetical protein KEM54_003626 [Ascosphaera aggregata]|nr:hypothetical protein KEM54_003626 [Ascosphaera aggregata]
MQIHHTHIRRKDFLPSLHPGLSHQSVCRLVPSLRGTAPVPILTTAASLSNSFVQSTQGPFISLLAPIRSTTSSAIANPTAPIGDTTSSARAYATAPIRHNNSPAIPYSTAPIGDTTSTARAYATAPIRNITSPTLASSAAPIRNITSPASANSTAPIRNITSPASANSTAPIRNITSPASASSTASFHSGGGGNFSEAPDTQTTTIAYQSRPTQRPKPMGNQNIFLPIASGPPPVDIPVRGDHPLKKQHIHNGDLPVSTNKFYANMFLGTQTMPVLTHPYSLTYTKGDGSGIPYGIAVSHIDRSLISFGPPQRELPGAPARFYLNPIGVWSLILSAKELDSSTTLTLQDPTAFSASAVLSKGDDSITFPMVQGMGFVTARYNGNLQPLLSTNVFFRYMEEVAGGVNGMSKYRVTLENNSTWLIYALADDGSYTKLTLSGNKTITGPKNFRGIIQVSKNPAGEDGEIIFDWTAGVYPTTMSITGSVNSNSKSGSYNFLWSRAGNMSDIPFLMYALPHHVESFDDRTRAAVTGLKLRTTTKGDATAVISDSWTMVEGDLPIDMDFAPWKPGSGSGELSDEAKPIISSVSATELRQDMVSQTDVDSMYYSGKGLAKFAFIVYTVSELLDDPDAAAKGLENLKQSFATFIKNSQRVPLVYDDVWKGVVSSGTYNTGDPNMDFGNTYYNDHHFHYGYFVLAAAVIGHLDESWLTDENKNYVNALLRDAGNSVSDDPYFPFSRGFDWFHGHSWAKGLFESADGKDQESTSEDTMFAYGVKMWGRTTGDASMEARGNMMLGLLRRSLRNYFLMESDNVAQPRPFIDNKVTGILFENKADHTTYFGTNLEYIQGIHMLPLFAASPYVRSKKFVDEEWAAMFAENAVTPASRVEGGWKGVLYSNDAIRDPKESWNFFAQDDFQNRWLDNGASRTWSLAFAAALGGA